MGRSMPLVRFNLLAEPAKDTSNSRRIGADLRRPERTG
jgi:hypothetical protein